jgi:hypothetical protein
MMKTPGTMKAIMVLVYFQLLIALLISFFSLALVDMWTGDDEFSEYRAAIVQGLGYDPDTYGAYDAGRVLGTTFVAIALLTLALVFIWRRRMTLLRVVLSLAVILGFAVGSLPLIQVVTLALTFLPSARTYMRRFGQ